LERAFGGGSGGFRFGGAGDRGAFEFGVVGGFGRFELGAQVTLEREVVGFAALAWLSRF